MHKTLTIASLAAAGVIALASPAAATWDEQPPTTLPPEPLLTAEAECGSVTVTLVNTGPRLRGVDFGFGDPTLELVDPNLVITQGPFAGEPFGLFYEAPNGANFTVPAGETGSATLDIPEDEGGGTVTVRYRVRFGPEQHDHLVGGTIDVDTDCEEEAPPTTVPEDEPVDPLPTTVPERTFECTSPDGIGFDYNDPTDGICPTEELTPTEPPVEVASQVVTADDTQPELAFTGDDTARNVAIGAGLLLVGASALWAGRRRGEVRR